jgi:hypothetical protein
MIVLRVKHENLELVEVQKLDPIVLPYREFMTAELKFDIDPVNTAAGLSLKLLEELRTHTGDWRILLKRFRYEPITFEGFVRVNWIFYSRMKFTKTVEELLF